MRAAPRTKYRPFPAVALPERRWPERVLSAPPRWCSVDLRDGNQALPSPMDHERKLRMFEALVALGFREIEVGFPSASQTDYDFVRFLVEARRVPEHVTIQVLTPARTELIRTTLESIRGAERAIVHLYNSTSELQRRVVFRMGRAGVAELAVRGAARIRELADELGGTDLRLEYSPESFTGTEPDFALEVCEAVMDVWEPSVERPVILNLPATVEMSTPNVFADRIEWFDRRLSRRDRVVLSVHPHNDRGTAVAAAELAVMAGAERVEGTLFGNGERTGNVDLVTLALNLYTQGIDPGLRIESIDALVELCEHCNQLPVHPRHPYAGELVYTAFSGSHQDAIKKGFEHMRGREDGCWEVPYLPIDPADLGRGYQAVIRVNSQSGKAGVAYLLERDFGLRLPRGLLIELRKRVQEIADATGTELASRTLYDLFREIYLDGEAALSLVDYRAQGATDCRESFAFELELLGERRGAEGGGNGPLDALTDALLRCLDLKVRVMDYSEHTLGEGSDARAIAYVELATPGGERAWGVAESESLLRASLEAAARAASRLLGRDAPE
jgi:2-isopropylmalate synthase